MLNNKINLDIDEVLIIKAATNDIISNYIRQTFDFSITGFFNAIVIKVIYELT